VPDLVAAATETQNLMPQGRECIRFLLDDAVLPARSAGAVTIVDKQYPHPGGVPSRQWHGLLIY